MDDAYFFDTYAIIEIIKGNQNYQKYKDAAAAITIFNIVELHYALLREYSSVIADAFAGKYSEFQVEIDFEIIKTANTLKLQHRKRDLSAADVIGYATAKN